MRKLILAQLLFAICTSSASTVVADGRLVVPQDVLSVIANRCIGCHDADTSEGNVRLDDLERRTLRERLELLNKAEEQVYFGRMPPEEEQQPTAEERAALAGWLRRELQKHDASKLEDKLRYPRYGNFVDHEQLFSGEAKTKAFTPARRWLVSPRIFHERVMDVFKLDGRDRVNYQHREFYGVTNPFVLPDDAGVRDYAFATLDGGHLLVMLNNAHWISQKQITAARIKNGELKADELPNPKDRWYPQTTPAAFEAVILNPATPADDRLVAAIEEQFDCVLRRKPSSEELVRYLDLTRSAIELGGNTEGLRQMLVAVLLESEFVYRLEFGTGETDEHGRQKLSPREAADAISYALGDRRADAQLADAAEQGRLTTKEDYRREVVRLLADKNHYQGQIDPSLNGKHFRSNESSHPKIIRFFREFFGYPSATKVFKDLIRSDGYYQNPGRGTTATPGRLILETDRIVTMYVEQDRNVFENLLTSDQFFVYHDKDNSAGRKIIEEWQGIYEQLKTTDWRADPERVLEENLEFLKAQKTLRISDASRSGELVNYMHFFEESFGQGRTPFTTIPWAHGYTFHHAPFYNLPPTPSIGRYGSWKSTEYRGGKIEKQAFWDYPTEQPFEIEHRKGVVTHPSWLIAHSQNTATDPVHRGKWVLEKLLAGRVPDVPITVDAQIPEDPHKTLRERLELKTSEQFCWKCHQKMDPLGLPFEMYDDFGRYRTRESLEHPDNFIAKSTQHNGADIFKTKPVNATGKLDGTGDPALDGEVTDALDLVDRLAKSVRTRQSIIRHAFRFYLGRNEMLSDAQTLIDADKAYVESDGSFQSVIVSLLTSDSFMYRKALKD